MFQTILFDIDGVMLSEERYFDASALTVYELLCSPQYFHLRAGLLPAFTVALTDEEIQAIRNHVFAQDEVLRAMKKVGINANWDMVFLQTTFQLTQALAKWEKQVGSQSAHHVLANLPETGWTRANVRYLGEAWQHHAYYPTVDYRAFVAFAADCKSKAELFAKLDGAVAELLGEVTPGLLNLRLLWELGQETFQEWYLGDSYVSATHQQGKKGFLKEEVPLAEPGKFARLLHRIREQGVTLGIATGRPETETRVPLQHLGWLDYFDENRISTASDVLQAEMKYPEYRPLAKPNPFSYLRSYLATPEAIKVLHHPLPLDVADGRQTLVVGDSVADLLAARKMGCMFAAVLTGLEGPTAKTQFEQMGSDYILSNVLDVSDLVR